MRERVLLSAGHRGVCILKSRGHLLRFKPRAHLPTSTRIIWVVGYNTSTTAYIIHKQIVRTGVETIYVYYDNIVIIAKDWKKKNTALPNMLIEIYVYEIHVY